MQAPQKFLRRFFRPLSLCCTALVFCIRPLSLVRCKNHYGTCLSRRERWHSFAVTGRALFCLPCAKGGGSAVSRAGGIVATVKARRQSFSQLHCQLPLHKEALNGKVFCSLFLFTAQLYFSAFALSVCFAASSPRGGAKFYAVQKLSRYLPLPLGEVA